jgi:hypothetical protein
MEEKKDIEGVYNPRAPNPKYATDPIVTKSVVRDTHTIRTLDSVVPFKLLALA